MNIVLAALAILAALVVLTMLLNARKVTTIYAPSVGLLYRNGRFERELPPGRYALFDPLGRIHIGQVWTAAWPVTLPEFSVVSKDQFAFRVGLSPVLEVEDARAYAESQPANQASPFSAHFAIQPLTAAAAHEAAASHSLSDLIATPSLMANAVQEQLASTIPGARIAQVLVTGITLPPETRKMFTDVARAKVEAEASLERARGEQASMRALANAARLIKDNPALARLRFLQTLEQAPGPKTIVLGADAMAPLNGAGN